MGVHSSCGRGVVNACGISSSRPVHRLVGVTWTVAAGVAVGIISFIGDGVLGGVLHGNAFVGAEISVSTLAQDAIKILIIITIKMTVESGSRAFMDSPLNAMMNETVGSGMWRGKLAVRLGRNLKLTLAKFIMLV